MENSGDISRTFPFLFSSFYFSQKFSRARDWGLFEPTPSGDVTRKHPLFYAFTRIFRRAFKFFSVLGHNTDRINISNSARKRYIQLDTTIRET
jgi:hypothetical protein